MISVNPVGRVKSMLFRPQRCTENPVGMIGYTETSLERFSVISPVLVLCAYGYQKGVSFVPAISFSSHAEG